MTLTLRAAKGSELSHAEMDANWAHVNPVGVHEVPISAVAMSPTGTAGATFAETSTATNGRLIRGFSFNATTPSFVELEFPVPKSVAEGTFTVRIGWTHPAATTNFGVAWMVAALACGNGDAQDAALGTAVTVTDTGGATGATYPRYVADESAAITPFGSWVDSDLLRIRIGRDTAHAFDDLAVAALLTDVKLIITTNSGTDNAILPVYLGGFDTPDNWMAGQTFTAADISQYFTDPQGDNIYSVSGAPWLSVVTGDDVTGVCVEGTYTVAVTATNSIGSTDGDSITLVVAPANTVPAVFATNQWSVVSAAAVGGDVITINITSLPDDGGSPITAVQISTNNGSTWNTIAGATAPGSYAYGAGVLTPLTTYTCEIRAVNAVGNGVASNHDKTVTPNPPGHTPSWVDNGGNTALVLEGSLTADSAYYEAFYLLRGLEGMTGASGARLRQWNGRSELFLQADGDLQVRMKDAANVTLVDWHSNGTTLLTAGAWLLYVRINLTGTPGFEVWRVNIESATAAWAQLTGAFFTGAIVGSINHSRTGTGNDSSFLANITPTPFFDCEFAFLWENFSSTQVGKTAMWNGALKNPATVGSPLVLLTGPAAGIGTNEGSGLSYTVSGGGFTDVGGGGSSGDPLDALNPEARVGFGATTTGGRGGAFVRVTSLSDSAATANSLRWALAQNVGQPLYIALCVEGAIQLATALTITRSNITIDGRYAPGQGCWLKGARLEIEASNVFLDHLRHYGNDPAGDDTTKTANSSDNLRWGRFSTDFAGTHVANLGYARRCSFLHGRDEGATINCRGNSQNTGNKATNITWDRCIVADSVGGGLTPDHAFATFLGNGTENFSMFNCLVSNHDARMPFARQYTAKMEFYNNAWYNGNENWAQFVSTCEARFQGNLLRLGPHWSDARAPLYIDSSSNKVYFNDNIMDTKVGKTSSGGLTRGSAALGSPFFTASAGYTIRAASTVAAYMTAANIGPLVHGGGAVNARDAQVFTDFVAGNVNLKTYPGALPSTTGASFPAHTGGVPNAYLAIYTTDTDPAAMITIGDWAGYMVAERIGAFLVSTNFTP